MNTSASPTRTPYSACSISGHLDTRTAAMEVADDLHDAMLSGCDLLLTFASFHHRSALPDAMEIIRNTISPRTSLAITAESVLGEEDELEGLAGLSAIGMKLPGARITPWFSTPADPIPISRADGVANRINVTHDLRAALLLADPFSTPITRLLPALVACGGQKLPVPVIGGMASGGNRPGQNVLVLDDRAFNAGAVGVTIAGEIEIDFVVSQGCRPIGDPFVVTKTDQNIVLELGGRPAMQVLQELTSDMSDEERQLLSRGILLGHVINENKRPFGRGDFLVRNILGFDQKRGGIAVGELCRPGQTVQFHVRDAQTAGEDLQLLLDAQMLDESPFAGLMFTCNGRGERLFGESNHDISIINHRFPGMPVAGFFAAGEIGPVGDKSFLHGHTASLALFRAVD